LGIKNKNVAVTVHDLNKLHIFGVDFITRTFITLKSCLLGKYKLISAPSHYVKNDILSHFKTDEESIYVMYNFIDLTKIDASRFNNSENANNSTILHVGSDMPNKNINLIYKILKVLPSSFKLIRVGANSQRNLKYAKDNDLLKRIIFYEGVSTEVLNDLYRTSSVFLYPSKFEGFGRPLLEAMAHGLPVVYRNSSSLPEIAGDAGLPFDTDDVKEVVELIYKSIDNPENERLRRRSLERSKFFDLKSQRDNILKFYELLLEP
jgi:glycosyltransferase involved in cell wall biosynthesis